MFERDKPLSGARRHSSRFCLFAEYKESAFDGELVGFGFSMGHLQVPPCGRQYAIVKRQEKLTP